jgi:4-hydroxy-2-oxoglutarate aldolase
VFPDRSDVLTQGLISGRASGIAALANIVPKVHARLWTEGKLEEVMKIQAMLGHGDWAVGKIGGISAVESCRP